MKCRTSIRLAVAWAVLVSAALMVTSCNRDNRDNLPPPGRTRLYCVACGAWMETDALTTSLFQENPGQQDDGKPTKADPKPADSFMGRHMACSLKTGKTGVLLRSLSPEDKMYNRLDPAKQEKAKAEKK